MTTKFWEGQVCVKFYCPSSAVILFSKDWEKGRGNPLLLGHRKPKQPSYPGRTIVYNYPCTLDTEVRCPKAVAFHVRSVTSTALCGRGSRGEGMKRRVWELNGLVIRNELSISCSQTSLTCYSFDFLSLIL